jgi:hypothetical protein
MIPYFPLGVFKERTGKDFYSGDSILYRILLHHKAFFWINFTCLFFIADNEMKCIIAVSSEHEESRCRNVILKKGEKFSSSYQEDIPVTAPAE